MHILITGGSGFIGHMLIQHLIASQHRVSVLDVKPQPTSLDLQQADSTQAGRWIVGDISDTETVINAAVNTDLIIHLAAMLTPECQNDPPRGAQVNFIGTLNVFEAAKKHTHKNLIYMSSASVYGPDNGHTPDPWTHYGVFKLAGEYCARSYWQDHGVASVGLRPLVIYGPGRETGISAGPTLACKAAAHGEPYTIPFSGETDLLFVEDLIATFQALIEAPSQDAQIYTVPGQLNTVEQIKQAILNECPDASISIDGPALPVSAHIESGELRKDFPQIPITTIEAGIAKTIDHYRSQT